MNAIATPSCRLPPDLIAEVLAPSFRRATDVSWAPREMRRSSLALALCRSAARNEGSITSWSNLISKYCPRWAYTWRITQRR
jgi:hypothetical protein